MTKSKLTLRLAEKAEIPLLASIQLEAAGRFPEDVLPEPMRSSYTVPGEIMDAAAGKGRLWVAHMGDSIPLGYAVWREAEGAAILEQVDVLPAWGKRGIGSALVRHVMARACEDGYPFLYLTTFSSVPWNAPFYMKLGFTIMEDEKLPRAVRAMIREERTLAANRVAMGCPLHCS